MIRHRSKFRVLYLCSSSVVAIKGINIIAPSPCCYFTFYTRKSSSKVEHLVKCFRRMFYILWR